jgi:hypothetical protein
MAMISTTKGQMDTAALQEREGRIDNENEETSWLEYWLLRESTGCDHHFDPRCQDADGSRPCLKGCGSLLVHRSVHMRLKKPAVFAEGVAAAFK